MRTGLRPHDDDEGTTAGLVSSDVVTDAGGRPAGGVLWDMAPAAVLFVAGMAGTRAAGADQGDVTRTPDTLAFLLVALATSSLAARRHRPRSVWVVCCACVAAYLFLGYPFGPVLFTVPVAAYAVGLRVPLRPAVSLVASVTALVLVSPLGRLLQPVDPPDWPGGIAWGLSMLGIVAGATAAGAAVRVRQESAAGVRAEQARRAVSEERLRMAQELHDSVGHGLAVVAMQAGVAMHVLTSDPDKARASLQAIRDTSREALNALRDELAQLREPDDGADVRRSRPGIGDLDVLVQRIGSGGVDVDLRIRMSAAELDQVAEQTHAAAYRIVQESLTNVLRHAGASSVSVDVRRDEEALVLEILDDGSGPDEIGPKGAGLTGMRGRAQSLGGELLVAARPEGGFSVLARLPRRPATDAVS